MAYLSHDNVFLYLVSPDRTRRYRVRHWSSLTAEHLEQQIGALELEFPLEAPWLVDAAADASVFDPFDGFYHWSLDLYVRATADPLWSGPFIARRATHDGTTGSARVTLIAETFLQNSLERASNFTSGFAVDSYSAKSAGRIILTVFKNAWGPTPVTPSGYPGSRGDAGPYWTYGAVAAHDVGTTLTIKEQSDSNLRAMIEHLAQKGDVYLLWDEASAASWELDVATYQKTDRSTGAGKIVLSPRDGTMLSFEHELTFEEMLNIYRMRGSGKDASQTTTWYEDSGSRTDYGNFESSRTLQEAASADLDSEGNAEIARQAAPLERIKMKVNDAGGAAEFNSDYHMRDKLAWHCPIFGWSGTAIVRGWKLGQSGTGPFELEHTLGDVRSSFGKEAMLQLGMRGTRGTNSRFVNRTGSP